MRIPHLALSAKKYSTVQRIAESNLLVGTLPLLLLPNWSFDYAYVLYMNGEKDKARQQVLESLMRWPQVLRLLHQNAVTPLIIVLLVESPISTLAITSGPSLLLPRFQQ